MRFYETVFIVRQDATPNQVEALVQDYTKIIESFQGKVTKTEFCGLRTLAYPIRKSKKGHYVLLNVAVKPEGVMEVERNMRINEDVIRYISTRVEKLDNNPSPLMQQKSYRDSIRPSSHDDFDTPLMPESQTREAHV